MIPVLLSRWSGQVQVLLSADCVQSFPVMSRVLVTGGNPPPPQCRMSPEEDLHKIEDILTFLYIMSELNSCNYNINR